MRCECDDQNDVAGDGCDARCQIEPCFTCTGTPSTCSPSADGAACDDRSACTSGETCSAGVCGGGSPVTPCIDLTGQWIGTETFPDSGEVFHSIVDIRQFGTTLEFGGSPTSVSLVFGMIDPGTGDMEVGAGDGLAACLSETGGATIAIGTGDSASYALLGTEGVVDTPCTLLTKTITGERCDGPCVLPTTTTSTSTTTTTSTSTTTITLPQLLTAKKLVLKDGSDPSRRGLTLSSSDRTLDGGSPADDPTVAGATLRVRTTAGCGGPCDATYTLPAGGWQPIGTPGQNKGYKYYDKLLASGPVKKVTVTPGKRLKIVAKGEHLAHQLAADPAPVDVVFALGTRRACMRFGGTTKLTAGRTFVASNAPAPAACP
jgi:cysteine-rich repeat protein